MKLFLKYFAHLCVAYAWFAIYRYLLVHKSSPITSEQALTLGVAMASAMMSVVSAMEAGRHWLLDVIESKKEGEDE